MRRFKRMIRDFDNTITMRLRNLLIAILTVTTGCAQTFETTTTAFEPNPTIAPPANLYLAESRSFSMGFTTWPHDFNQEAVDWTWTAISQHSDLIALHLDSGVPWQEALNGHRFPTAVQAELEDIARRSEEFETVYVAATPQHSDRATLARYWNDNGSQQPLPASWNGLSLDDERVLTAYLNHCVRLIEELDPDYFAYGIEVNAGYAPGSPPHDQMLTLVEAVYPALKSRFPDLPVFLTFQIDSWVVGNDEALEITRSFLPYTDIVGISAYPFLDFRNPGSDEPTPDPVEDWMGPLASLGKPIAVTETGFPAEPLAIDSLGVDMTATPEWQSDFVVDLLATSNTQDAQFVVYWEIRDYDRGYESLVELGADPALARIWKDVGLYDGDGEPRSALGVWDAWLSLADR